MNRQLTADRPDLITGRTLARLGLGLLLLGLVFLYRWGIEQGIVTPTARVALGVALSAGMLTVGWATRTKQPLFGALLQGGGVAGLFVSAWAAHAVYHLTSETAVFTHLVFVSTLSISLAVHQRIETLAVVGVLGALAAPQMVGGTIGAYPGDAGYVALVLVVVGVLLFTNDWKVLYSAAAIATAATLVAELGGIRSAWVFTGSEALIAYAAALLALWGAPVLRLALGRPQDPTIAMVATVTIPVAVYFGAWTAWEQPSRLVWGIAAAGLSISMSTVYIQLRNREAFAAVLHLLPASVLSVTAVAMIFEGPGLVLTLAAQAVGFVLIGRHLRVSLLTGLGWAIYGVTAAFSSIAMVILPTSGVPALNGDALSRLGVVGLGAVLAVALGRSGSKSDEGLGRLMAGFAHVAFLVWGLSELTRTAIGQPAVSAMWGAYALIIIAVSWSRSRMVRNVGVGTLLVTVGKVFLADLEQASGGAKILLLMGFGLTLLALGYLMPSSDSTPHGPVGAPADNSWGEAETLQRVVGD